MKKHETFRLRRDALRLVAAAALTLFAHSAASAQGSPGTSAPGFKNPKGETDAQTNREAKMRTRRGSYRAHSRARIDASEAQPVSGT